MSSVIFHFEAGNSARFTKTHNQRGSERARSETFLLAAARHLTVESHFGLPAHIKRSNAFRPVQLVTADRHQVNVAFLNVHGHLTDGLGGVSVEENLVFLADGRDFVNRLHDTDLIVDVDDGASKSIRSNGLLQYF